MSPWRFGVALLAAPVLAVTALIAFGPMGCGSANRPDSARNGSQGADGGKTADASSTDALPDGAYWSGVYLCCGEGQGRSCCPPEMLPDPAAGRSAKCFQYGGVRGACTGAGETLEAKDICSTCCPGLKRIEMLVPAEAGPISVSDASCTDDAPPSVFRCTACGDGTCGDGENVCNCPEDCQ
jgi:hypothetical protein